MTIRAKRAVEGETKVDKFKRIATYRLNNVLTDLNVLSNCADNATYDYTDEQVQIIVNVLKKRLSDLEEAFAQGGKAKSGGVTL